MRDESYRDHDADALDASAQDASALGGSRWAAAIGAALSVVILAGVVVWSYRLGVRDANDVPVIRAVAGLAKVQPEDAGGTQFAHQGRAVYDLMSGVATTQGATELAPAAEALAAEDVPAEAFAPRARPAELAEWVDVTAAPEAEAEAAPETGFGSEVDALVAAVLGQTPTGAAPARSPLAPPRPRADTPSAPQAAAIAAAPDVAPAPTGFEVQVGTYRTEAEAQRQWEGVAARNGDLLAGHPQVISPLDESGQVLYRLRAAAFADLGSAREACARLLGRGEECIVVGTR